jgi:hypothetical protein
LKDRFGSDINFAIMFNDGEEKFDQVLGDGAAAASQGGDET